jgi:drug/metabolite transporter (DMT)-like permease
MNRDRAIYFAALLGATLLMASSFIAGKAVLATGIPSFLLLSSRFALATLATLPLVRLDGPGFLTRLMPPAFGAWRWIVLALIGIVQTAGVMGFLFLGLRTISPSTTAILIFTNPIWVALLGRLILGERLTAPRIGGLVCGVLGVAFALGFDHLADEPLGGKLLAFAGAVCFAAATVTTKRVALPIGVWGFNFWQMAAGTLVLLALAVVQGGAWPQFGLGDWGWFVWLPIPGSTGAYGLWYEALRRGGATRTSGYMFLVPLFTVLMAAALLGSPLSWPQGVGGVLIGLGLWLANRPARPHTPPSPVIVTAASQR